VRRTLILAAATVALLGCGDDATRSAPETIVRVGDASVRVEVADDEASREQGLSGRDELPPDAGMLFVLDTDRPAFWMRGMRFPLDIVWIKHGRVVDITARIPTPGPGGGLPTYSPRPAANRALEVNAGWAARHGVRRGDPVRLYRGAVSE
jgi:uncharacterized protein